MKFIKNSFSIAMLLFLWTIDVSVSALLNGNKVGNGFFTLDPMKVYHVCLYVIVALIIMCSFDRKVFK